MRFWNAISSRSLAAALTLGGVLAVATGCGEERPHRDPPLRPLLHTESPPGIERALEGFEEWTDPSIDPVAWPLSETLVSRTRASQAAVAARPARTPEALLLGVFHALAQQQPAALTPYVFTPEELQQAGRMGIEAARREVESQRQGLEELMAAFSPGVASLARADGLRRMLGAGPVVVGRPRTIDGALLRGPGTPAMHWGSELQIELVGTNAAFVLRFPRILIDTDGHWRLAAVPTVDARFQAFRALGFDLKRELMQSEHAPYPLSVGNFWHYRTRRPAPPAEGDEPGPGLITPNGYRDEVTDVIDLEMYRVVRFRRLYDNPSRATETFAWLQSPTRIHRCSWDCLRNARDVAWVLAWAPQQSPLYAFPIEPGMSWGIGGTSAANPTWRVSAETHDVSVPAGRFIAAREIVRTAAGGRDSVFFVPGAGAVLRRQLRGIETEIEELVSYRIMP